MTATLLNSPGARLIAIADGERFLTREVAEILGVSVSMVRKLNTTHPDSLGASDVGLDGNRRIWLYTAQDVDRLRAYFAHHTVVMPAAQLRDGARKPGRGRPSMWTPEERDRRDRAHVKVGYHRKRARQLEAAGREDDAARYRAEADRLKADLNAEAAQRTAERATVRPLAAAATAAGRRTPARP